jgi:hypothetical protein
MNDLRFRQICLKFAKQIYPNVGDIQQNIEADRIYEYLNTNGSQNIVSLNLMCSDIFSFADGLELKGSPLDLRDYQRVLLETWSRGDESLVIHARQLGITTLLAIYALWVACYGNAASIGLISINHNTSTELVRLIVDLHKSSAFKLPKFTSITRNKMAFENGNTIHFINPGTYLAGQSLTHLFVDNAGHISLADDENIYSSFLMTTNQVIITGTPNMTAGIFYDLSSSHSWFRTGKTFMPFTVYDEYDESWEANMRARLDHYEFESQFNCHFRQTY